MIDYEIIEECRKGNLNSFSELVVKTSPFVFSVAFRMIGDETVAEDIVQDTMLTVWQKIGKINSSDGFKMWLYRIVVNKCYDELRRKERSKEYTPDEFEWTVISNHISHDTIKEMENRETAALINLLTGSLSPKQKAVFVLCDLEEMNTDEVSAITGMSMANIKANLHYARRRISEMLNKFT